MPAPATQELKFSCTSCGKEFRWKPELAGKKAKCKCGSVISVPAKPPAAPAPKSEDMDLDQLYALAQEEQKATSRPVAEEEVATGYRCPGCSSSLAPGTVICPNCQMDMRTGQRPTRQAAGSVSDAARGFVTSNRGGGGAPAMVMRGGAGVLPYGGGVPQGTNAARASQDMIWEGGKARSLYLPVGLIILGVLFYFGTYGMGANRMTAGLLLLFVGVRVVLDAMLILVAMFIAVRAFDMGFGAFGPALLKIFAIAIGPGALAAMLNRMVGGGFAGMMLGSGVQLLLIYLFIMLLFQLDLGETILLDILIYAVQHWVGMFLLVAVVGMLSSGGISNRGATAVLGTGAAIATAGADKPEYPPKRPKDPAEIAFELDEMAELGMRDVWTNAADYLKAGHMFAVYGDEGSQKVLDMLADMGAKSVVTTHNADVMVNDVQRSVATSLTIELPDDKSQRAAIFEWYHGEMKKQGQRLPLVEVEVGGAPNEKLKVEPLKDWGQKYLEVDLHDPKLWDNSVAKKRFEDRMKRLKEEGRLPADDEDEEEMVEEGADDEDMTEEGAEGDAPAAKKATPKAKANAKAPAEAEESDMTEEDAAEPKADAAATTEPPAATEAPADPPAEEKPAEEQPAEEKPAETPAEAAPF
ncbi:MAG TPA: DMT family transporter [Tepidisphaeraceae bacterium]|nr:DMT family transporter [Tepidisphaeraceae bacterium]